jgi:hypothetical protein
VLLLSDQKRLPGWVAGVGLSLGGIACSGILILIFFAAFPQYRPGYTVFTVSMGDIFFHRPDLVRAPQNANDILASYWIGWDENGFRLSEAQAEQYAILALGDSFTEAPNAARPWTDVLAAESNVPVRNLAYRAFGPVEQLEVVQRFGAEIQPEIVIIGYFEGNDLSNAITSQEKPVDMPWMVSDNQRQLIKTDTTTTSTGNERYPMLVSINGIDRDIAFFEPYAWILNASRGSFERSQNMQITIDSYRQMQEVLPEACFIVAYFPGAPHIYLPYLKEEYQPIFMQEAEEYQAVETGSPLERSFIPNAPFETLLERLPNQRDAIQRQIEGANLIFFDLTPILEEAAAQGQMLYYTYDTHWNQAGHDVVGKAIAEFLATNPC